MTDVEEYEKVREGLFSTLIEAYCDSYILDGLDKYFHNEGNDNWYLFSPTFIKHVIFLLQKDFALCLWKADSDTDKEACTISRLRNLKEKIICKDNVFQKVKKGKISNVGKRTISGIGSLRNASIAHMDYERSGETISIHKMRELLEEYRKSYNDLAVIDNYSYVITDSFLNKKMTDIEMELLLLFSCKNTI